jgi:hypothetical protein
MQAYAIGEHGKCTRHYTVSKIKDNGVTYIDWTPENTLNWQPPSLSVTDWMSILFVQIICNVPCFFFYLTFVHTVLLVHSAIIDCYTSCQERRRLREAAYANLTYQLQLPAQEFTNIV